MHGAHALWPLAYMTILTGPLRDQSALYGVLMRMRDLGLTLISVRRVEPREKT
jgi:hypothetical protein